MLNQEKKLSVWSTGLAMFAMFFGAGNIVFPLALGQFTQDKNFYAVLGMVVTAVFVPLAGLLGTMLFEGDYNAFFRRIGRVPGYLVTVAILCLIGPFAGIPRCINISYATLASFGLHELPGVSLLTFSAFSCVVIFLMTFRPGRIVPLLGYVLTPLLLVALAVLVIRGVFLMPEAELSAHTRWETFVSGLVGGYNTLDLLAAFFFSSAVLLSLKRSSGDVRPLRENRRLFSVALLGSFIAAGLLTLVYVSFSYIAAGYSHSLEGIAGHEILGRLAGRLLGPYAGLIASVAMAFACLTTEIALAAIFAEYLRKNLCREKISYEWALILTLFVAFLVSTLQFEGITALLAPLLKVCYPALIVLTVLNILYKLYAFKPVKLFVYGTFLVSLFLYLR